MVVMVVFVVEGMEVEIDISSVGGLFPQVTEIICLIARLPDLLVHQKCA